LQITYSKLPATSASSATADASADLLFFLSTGDFSDLILRLPAMFIVDVLIDGINIKLYDATTYVT